MVSPPTLVHHRSRIDDPDGIRDAVSGTTMRVDRLSRPLASSYVEQLQSGHGWVLDVANLQCRLHAEGAFPVGSIGVMLVRKAAGTSFCGKPLADGMLVTIPGGTTMDVSVVPGFSYAGTQVPLQSWFAAQLLDTGLLGKDSVIGVRQLPADQAAVSEGRLAHAIGLLRVAAGGGTGPDPSAVMEDHVVWLAGSAASSGDAPSLRHSGSLLRVAARAREWIHAHISAPIRTADLCRGVGVSRRRLEYAFRAVFDVSPQGFIHAVRLNEIHRALLNPRSRDRSVADVALAYGINHFGRFAASYRAIFGELPRETRTAARIGVRISLAANRTAQ